VSWISSLQLQLGTPPMSPLGVVTNRVSGTHPDPLRDGAILLPLLGKLLLDPEGLQGGHFNVFSSEITEN